MINGNQIIGLDLTSLQWTNNLLSLDFVDPIPANLENRDIIVVLQKRDGKKGGYKHSSLGKKTRIPTDPFTTLELPNSSDDVPKLNKIR